MAKYSIKRIYWKSQTQIKVNESEMDVLNNTTKAMGTATKIPNKYAILEKL